MKKISLLICFAFILFSCGKEETQEKTVTLRPAKFIVIKETGLKNTSTFSGVSKAKEESKLSFRVAGTVNKILVKVGDRVRRGQTIASIDPADYSVNLQQMRAQEASSKASEKSAETQIKSAESNYTAAKSSYERIEKLYENNSVSLSQFEQAKASYEAAQASLNAARSQYNASKSQTTAAQKSVQSAQNQVSYTRISAPFSGVISAQQVEENELVGSGTPIVTLSSEGMPEVQVGVPEILISKIKQGMKTQVRFSILPDKTFEGKVSEVGYVLNGSTYPVTVELVTSDDVIRPGMPADVSFSIDVPKGTENHIIVPAGAVGEDTKGRFVLLLNKIDENSAVVKKQYVEIGDLHKNGFVITNGLSGGAMVATAGLNTLQEGDKVRIN